MKMLLVFVVGVLFAVLLTSCGSKKAGNSNGGSNSGGSSPTVPLPTFSIDDLADITSANAGRFTVSGTCLEEGQPIEVSVGLISPGTNPDCTNGTWTIDIDVTGLNKTEGEISVTADHSPATGSAHPQQTKTVTNEFICSDNYVGVPALADYTTHSFCVMKYEAKSDESDTDADDEYLLT